MFSSSMWKFIFVVSRIYEIYFTGCFHKFIHSNIFTVRYVTIRDVDHLWKGLGFLLVEPRYRKRIVAMVPVGIFLMGKRTKMSFSKCLTSKKTGLTPSGLFFGASSCQLESISIPFSDPLALLRHSFFTWKPEKSILFIVNLYGYLYDTSP